MKTKSKEYNVNVITLGCSKNLVDSENIITQLQANGVQAEHEKSKDDANVIIVNTCGFIESAKQESIDTILGYVEEKKEGNIDKLYVTGCLSHRYQDDLSTAIPEVDDWFGTMDLVPLLQRFNADYKSELLGSRITTTAPHYAYLKISEGCNRTCSFCAIPAMRGKHRSRSIESLVDEAKQLAARGVKELMLIAQELTYYGLDIYKKRKLADLLDALCEVDGIGWIRLHYAYPSKFPIEIIDVMARQTKICNYLDMPLQHADDAVLKGMKRQITRAETEQLIRDIRAKIPGIALRTTFLVGFPGETEASFSALMDFVRDQRFERVGVFQYSHEDGTSAYSMDDDLSSEVKQDRADRLMAIQQDISHEKNQALVNQTLKVLIDRKEGQYFIGRTEFDSPEVDNEVLIDASQYYLRIGDFAQITITKADDYDLWGVPAAV